MDVDRIHKQLSHFIARHHVEFAELPRIQTQLLELGAMTLAAEHYRLHDYTIEPSNLIEGRFRVKVTSRGDPWNYSWFTVRRRGKCFEIHSNLTVLGAYGLDGGRYVVDVAVTQPDTVPRIRREENKKFALPNECLSTFVEAKKLVVYPMLLAQFVGIVHEILPGFLSGLPRGFAPQGHFRPALVSTGYPAGTSRDIINGFVNRGFRICVIPHFDVSLAGMTRGIAERSPFDPPHNVTA